jgi:hypothetical protein
MTFNGSNLTVTGTEIIKYNGSGTSNSYGSGIDTLTLQSSIAAYSNSVASLYLGNATAGYPLARMYALDLATSTAPLSTLVFQTSTATANTGNTGVTVLSATGVDQTFTVPAGVTSLTVSLWSGGGGGGATGTPGAAGYYITGVLTVSPGQTLKVIVGSGGAYNSTSTTYGGGGASGGAGGACGGGRSAIQLQLTAIITSAVASGTTITYTTSTAHGLVNNYGVTVTNINATYNQSGQVTVVSTTQFSIVNSATAGSVSSVAGVIYLELVDVGGGGGSYQGSGDGSPGGGGLTTGGNGLAPYNGQGGTQSAGGAPGTYSSPNGTAGSFLTGGLSPLTKGGGGGGGGWYGGGGGDNYGGGGGGSSYTSYPGFALTNSSVTGSTDTNYGAGGWGIAGTGGTNGGPGRVVIISPVVYQMAEVMRINSNGYLGVGTSAPAYTLDVTGTSRVTSNLGVGVAPIATAGSVNVAGGYYVNGVQLSGGSTISNYSNSGAVLLATGTSTGLQGSSNLFFSNSSNLGIQTITPATALDVNGGVTIRNGYRPLYSNVSTGTSLSISANTYGTHYNITTTALTAITLPTITWASDSNAYWVFRNNTGTYLSITFTYTSAGTTAPTNPVTIPPANSVTMMLTYPGGTTSNYVLF